MVAEIPEWIREWISKDRLVANKFRISKQYLRHSKRIQFQQGKKDEAGRWLSFHFIVLSPKYGKYNVVYESGEFRCNCPFFKYRKICSHILGVCQLTEVWPSKESIFS
jgi:hypothetical protein